MRHSKENEEKQKKVEEEKLKKELQMLSHIFEEADKDGGGTVTLDEFLSLVDHEEVRQMFQLLGLPVSRKSLATRLFEVLDPEDHGAIGAHSFVDRVFALKGEGQA